MGISASAIKLLLELKKNNNNFTGKVLQLGRQNIFVDRAKVLKLAQDMGMEVTNYIYNDYVDGNINDIMLFKMLGFGEVHSIDYSDFEDATYVHDFNRPVPENLHNQYDLTSQARNISYRLLK